jgi:hypothetical protein
MRTLVANLEVSVKIIFGDQRDLTKADIGQIFSDINFTQTKVMPRHAMRLNSTDPIINWARAIAQMPVIKNNGGMTEHKNFVTKKVKHITTLSIITRYCRGFIGGDYLQRKSTASLTLKDGRELTKEEFERKSSFGSLFLEQWATYQGERFYKDKTGYQIGSMVIQALGLVGYTIIYKNELVKNDYEILAELDRCAKVLADLNYAKNAEHWGRCRLMVKRENGYYNSTQGGSGFRVALADYFCKLVGYNFVT